MTTTALIGAGVFDGKHRHHNAALLIKGKHVQSINTLDTVPANARVVELDGGVLIPGLVDLQVNGGGGVMFNEAPSVESIKTICDSHARFGTTSVLVTLISSSSETTTAAIEAAIAANLDSVPGFIGLHLEGPHLTPAKRGAHDARFIRPMTNTDLTQLIDAKQQLPCLKITVAPEAVDDQGWSDCQPWP